MLILKDWQNQIVIEDLPETYQQMAEHIGVSAALKLGEIMGGEGIYLPKIDNIRSKYRNRLIKSDLVVGLSYKQVARKYGITERWVRIIEQSKEDARVRQTD
ncbi:MAG: Mor transcription activator family protein [Nitrospirota bacterium]